MVLIAMASIVGCKSSSAGPCAGVTCPVGQQCSSASGACELTPAPQPRAADLDLGLNLRVLAAGGGSLYVVAYSPGSRGLVALRYPSSEGEPEVRAVTPPGSDLGEAFDATLDAVDVLRVAWLDPQRVARVTAPFSTSVPPLEMEGGGGAPLAGRPSLQPRGSGLALAWADTLGRVRYCSDVKPGGQREVVSLVKGLEEPRETAFAGPRLVVFGGREYLFLADRASGELLVADREQGVWYADRLGQQVVPADDSEPSFDALILPDGRPLALFRDAAGGRLHLALQTPEGVESWLVDSGSQDGNLRSSVGWSPTLAVDPDGRAWLGALDATAAAFRVWIWDATTGPQDQGSAQGPLLSPALALRGATPWVVGAKPLQVGDTWVRRLNAARLLPEL